MLNSGDNLALRIAETLKQRCTHETLERIAAEAGIAIGEGISKRDRVLAGLAGWDRRALAAVAQRLGALLDDYELEETALLILEEGEPPITEITRRDMARLFGHELGGEQPIDGILRRFWPIDAMSGVFSARCSLAQDIVQHMILNPTDWEAEQLFTYIGALTCSRARFVRFLEAVLHPLARRGPGQEQFARAINDMLRRDGYQLEVTGEESGYSVYNVRPLHRGVAGAPKNLIFASTGPKPELGFSDAVNNDVVILSGSENCLIYDRPIRRDGLFWAELVGWWSDQMGNDERIAARALGHRLGASLASLAEKTVFERYFKHVRPRLGANLPALIPQVYLHYDPAFVRGLRRRDSFSRQRMDFLMLLPNAARVVIEVDGQHHFSREGKPSLSAYSEMVSADRDLRLAGYEVYRFGANELVGPRAADLIDDFFDRLLMQHGFGDLV